MKLYYLKAPWDDQGKIKMYYGMSRVKKQSGKRSILLMIICLTQRHKYMKIEQNSTYDFKDSIVYF